MFVKICGITSKEDALGAVASGANAVGFVFAPSPRQIDRVTAGDISRLLPPEVLNVGVFMNHSKENVIRTVNKVGLKAVQLHGVETPEETKWIKDRVPYVIKSFVGGSSALFEAKKWNTDIILIDSPTPGSGKVFDWEQADNAPPGLRVLLAGGLTPENVGAAIKRVKPWGVDVSSGVEHQVGKKDLNSVKQFIAAAKLADGENKQNQSQISQETSPAAGTSEKMPFDWETTDLQDE